MPRIAQATPTALCDSVGPQGWTKGLLRTARGKCTSPARGIFTDNRLSTQEESAHRGLWYFNQLAQPQADSSLASPRSSLAEGLCLANCLLDFVAAVASGTFVRQMRSHIDTDVPNSRTAAFQRNSNGRRNITASVSMPDMAKIGSPARRSASRPCAAEARNLPAHDAVVRTTRLPLATVMPGPLNARLRTNDRSFPITAPV